MSETCTLYEDGTCSGTPVNWYLFYFEDDLLVRMNASGNRNSWQSGTNLIQDVEYALLSGEDFANAVKSSVANNNYDSRGINLRYVEEAEGTLYRGVYTGFPFTLTYQTAEQLTVPTNLSATNITSSGATVSWTGDENATSYKVEYRQNGQSTWIDADS